MWQTRIPLEACGAFVAPQMFSLAAAHEAFTENGELKDHALQQRLVQNLTDFIEIVRKFTQT